MATIKSVLIIGGSGFIGTHLALRLRDNYKVFSTFDGPYTKIPGITFLPLQVDNRVWIKRVLFTIQPDVIVYVAGNNNLRWAESNAHRAEVLHSTGPALIASSADILQPRFIYLSNPYVFDGTRGNYHESDIVLPRSVLGRMKLGGENAIRSKCLNYIILRSSPVFGRGNGLSHSFLDHLRMNLDRKKRIEVSTQEIHSFAPVTGLCEVIQRLIDSGVRNRFIHYSGLTKVNHYEFSQAFAKRFKYDPNLIVPKSSGSQKGGSSEEIVYDFSVNSTQAAETLKVKPFLLEEGFDLIDQQLITRP